MPSVSSSSPFPPPPEFFKLYNDAENIERRPKPPSLPKKGETYEAFGATHADPTRLMSPEINAEGGDDDDAGFPFQKLYGNDGGKRIDAKVEIKRLIRMTLERFKALTSDLQDAPSKTNERVEEIALLLNNLHHLLNSIRPAQARSTVEFILKQQIEQKKEALKDLESSTSKILDSNN